MPFSIFLLPILGARVLAFAICCKCHHASHLLPHFRTLSFSSSLSAFIFALQVRLRFSLSLSVLFPPPSLLSARHQLYAKAGAGVFAREGMKISPSPWGGEKSAQVEVSARTRSLLASLFSLGGGEKEGEKLDLPKINKLSSLCLRERERERRRMVEK